MFRSTTLLGVLVARFIIMLSEVDHVGQRDLIHREEGDSPAVDHSKQNRSLAHIYMVSLFFGCCATTTKNLKLSPVQVFKMHIIYRMF
jgi:hypothetical protein